MTRLASPILQRLPAVCMVCTDGFVPDSTVPQRRLLWSSSTLRLQCFSDFNPTIVLAGSRGVYGEEDAFTSLAANGRAHYYQMGYTESKRWWSNRSGLCGWFPSLEIFLLG